MGFQRATIILFIIVCLIYIACMSKAHVRATRILSEDFSETNHLVAFPVMYENAKEKMSYWLQRLASGPSPKGPGN
ncbi:hypothetical protein OROGR_026061 [Orobanche gracilis]